MIPRSSRDAGVVLVTVKSADTAGIADIIAKHAPPDAVIVSLQNGVGNVAVLRKRLPGRRVLGGMVPFNVIAIGEGRFHRATSRRHRHRAGRRRHRRQAVGAGPEAAREPQHDRRAMGQAAVNFNNALNALADMPLAGNSRTGAWRRLFADQMAEGLAVIKAEGIKPVSSTPVPAGLTPHLLRLPDPIFAMLLGRTMKIDPEARSSMWEDLQRGRRTEIDYLQG